MPGRQVLSAPTQPNGTASPEHRRSSGQLPAATRQQLLRAAGFGSRHVSLWSGTPGAGEPSAPPRLIPAQRGGLATVLALPGPAASLCLAVTSRRAPRTRHQGETVPASSPGARSPLEPRPADMPRRGTPTQGPRLAAAASRGAAGGCDPRLGQPPRPALRLAGDLLPRPADGGGGRAGNFGAGWVRQRTGPARPCAAPRVPPRDSPGPPDPRPRRAAPVGKGEPRPRRQPHHLLGLGAARQPRLQLAHNFQHRLRHFYCWRGRGGGSGFTARWPHGVSPPPPPSWLRAGSGSAVAIAPAGGGHGE